METLYFRRDLVHWTDEGSTLQPKEWYEKNGCYSGSGIATEDDILLFYTGNVRDAEGGRETYQCVAVSDDGKSFRKKGLDLSARWIHSTFS